MKCFSLRYIFYSFSKLCFIFYFLLSICLGSEKQFEDYLEKIRIFQKEAQYQNAIDIAKTALQFSREKFGTNHPNVATILKRIADLYQYFGNFKEAKSLYHQSLAIFEKDHTNHNLEIIDILNNLVRIYESQEDLKQALIMISSILGIEKTLYSEDDQHIGKTSNHLAFLLLSLKRYDEALVYFEKALKIFEKKGKDNPHVAYVIENLIQLYQDTGETGKKALLTKRLLKMKTKNDEWNKLILEAESLYKQGHISQAIKTARSALIIAKNNFGPSYQTINSLEDLAKFYQKNDDMPIKSDHGSNAK